MTPEAYAALVQRLVEVTAERDRAIGWAVALEQEVTDLGVRLNQKPAPGPCCADSGVIWPGRSYTTRCDLRAGHAGAHEADRGSMGGTAVWTDAEVSP